MWIKSDFFFLGKALKIKWLVGGINLNKLSVQIFMNSGQTWFVLKFTEWEELVISDIDRLLELAWASLINSDAEWNK